jgi:hypothetical protein
MNFLSGSRYLAILAFNSNDPEPMKLLVLAMIAWGFPGSCTAGERPDHFFNSYTASMYTNVSWGPETNGLRLGVQLPWTWGPRSSRKLDVSTSLFNTTPTNRYGLIKPPSGCRLDLALESAEGKAIPRTPFGETLCKPVPGTLRSTGRVITVPGRALSKYDEPFNLLKSFHLRQPGKYSLTVNARLYALGSTSNSVQIHLAPVDLTVEVSEADLED